MLPLYLSLPTVIVFSGANRATISDPTSLTQKILIVYFSPRDQRILYQKIVELRSRQCGAKLNDVNIVNITNRLFTIKNIKTVR
jgi:hypothetical protein